MKINSKKLGIAAALAVTGAFAASLAGPAMGQRSSLALLGNLDRGSWEIRMRDGSDSQRICVRNGREMIQLRHSSLRCSQVVVTDEPNEVTVQYTCPGKGYGRTQIRQESRKLLQINSQGIADGLPFSFSAEARHRGSC